MKAKCNKCGKEVECSNEIQRTDKVIIFDDNSCCPGFKAFHKVEPEPVIELDRENSIHFECKHCGKVMNVSSKSLVVYKNTVSLCCNKGPESYTIIGDTTYNHGTSFKEDKEYKDDLYGDHSSNWNEHNYSNYEDDE